MRMTFDIDGDWLGYPRTPPPPVTLYAISNVLVTL
jgi:hypothetical protein